MNIEDRNGNRPLDLAQSAFEALLSMEEELMAMAETDEDSTLTPVRLRQIGTEYQQVIMLLMNREASQ